MQRYDFSKTYATLLFILCLDCLIDLAFFSVIIRVVMDFINRFCKFKKKVYLCAIFKHTS
jgi:hypothetical protein